MKILAMLMTTAGGGRAFLYCLAGNVLHSRQDGGQGFGLSDDFMAQKQVQVLFSNQGLYNAFLALGLLWA